jgi:hypothetical protein
MFDIEICVHIFKAKAFGKYRGKRFQSGLPDGTFFNNKNPNLEDFGIFKAIWNIKDHLVYLRPFGIFKAIWYI